MEAGRPHHIRPTGPSDIRRIEAGILNWGADITLEDTPYHVGLDWLVDSGKRADYIGKVALARLREQGVTRKLVGIEISGERIEFNMTKWPVRSGGREVGRVTSAIYSPRLEKNIGYAMVPIDLARSGTRLELVLPGDEARQATVVPKPFVDPAKEIPKS
jgi:aminomethyltransferase